MMPSYDVAIIVAGPAGCTLKRKGSQLRSEQLIGGGPQMNSGISASFPAKATMIRRDRPPCEHYRRD